MKNTIRTELQKAVRQATVKYKRDREQMCNCYDGYVIRNPVDGEVVGCHLLPIGDGCGGFVTKELLDEIRVKKNGI